MRTKKVLKKIAAISTGVAMLGATMTGALALSYTLNDYPLPFIQNGIFSGVIAVGQNAMASDTIGQAILLADLQTKAVSPVGTNYVSGKGEDEAVPLGSNIVAENELDTILDDGEIDSLLDTEINFKGSSYDVSEVLVFDRTKGVTVETSLTSSEDEYLTDVVLEIAKDGIKYFYQFDETIPINETTSDNPLEIKFLGKTLKITEINSNTKFTAYVGSEYFLYTGDSVVIDGKTVKLVRVGSAGSIVVDVDAVTETISSGSTKTINGVEIVNEDTFYDGNNPTQSAASLIIGKDAQETYKDGDAYIGEDEDNPDWIWNLAGLNTALGSTSVSSDNNGITENGVIFGIENDFLINDNDDNPIKEGDCIELPNNYLSLCLDSLTVYDEDYAEYTLGYDNSIDLSDIDNSWDDVKGLVIHTSQDEGLQTDSDFKSKKTKELYLYGINDTTFGHYYKDSDGDIELAGYIEANGSETEIANINYGNTKGDDIRLYFSFVSDNKAVLELKPYTNDLKDYGDNIKTTWAISSDTIASLGESLSEDEASELQWNNTNIGTKDEDHRSEYGIIIRDPKGHGSSDEVVLDIPGEQVKANIVVKGTGTTSTQTAVSGSVIVNPIPSSAVALAEEVASASAQNLIVVGGPAVNPLAYSVFGLVREDFTPNEAMIKLADNGANVALLVAGYSAVDTRNAAEAVAAGKLAGLTKAEAKVVSTTQAVGSYTIE